MFSADIYCIRYVICTCTKFLVYGNSSHQWLLQAFLISGNILELLLDHVIYCVVQTFSDLTVHNQHSKTTLPKRTWTRTTYGILCNISNHRHSNRRTGRPWPPDLKICNKNYILPYKSTLISLCGPPRLERFPKLLYQTITRLKTAKRASPSIPNNKLYWLL